MNEAEMVSIGVENKANFAKQVIGRNWLVQVY